MSLQGNECLCTTNIVFIGYCVWILCPHVCIYSVQTSMSAASPITCVSTSVSTAQEVTPVSVQRDISCRETGCVKVLQSSFILSPSSVLFPFLVYLSSSYPPVCFHTQQMFLCSPSLPPLPRLFEDNGLGTWPFLLSSALEQGIQVPLNQCCRGKNAEVGQHKHTATLCCPAEPTL